MAGSFQKIITSPSEDEVYSLKKSNEAKGRFISILSHNVKAPLNYFHHVASFLEKNWDSLSDSEKKESISALSESSEAMINLVQQVLMWSKARIPSELDDNSEVSLSRTIDEVFELFAGQAQLKGITFVNEIDKEFEIGAERRILHLILQNLVSNAIKFSYNKGEITARTKENVLEIIDEGIGMNKEELEKLNNPSIAFTRRGTNNEEGTGVGMTIVYDLLPSIGASIEFESETNKGTITRLIFN